MSLKEAEMHVISAVAAVLIVASVAGPTLWMTSAADVGEPPLQEHTVIEASLAMRKEKANQPQKKFRPPDPVAKPVGVDTKDDRKPPVEPKKPDEQPKHDDKVSTDIDKYKHASDDDPVGPTTKPTVGDFNGSEKGFADISTGDPWLGKLNADLEFAPPEIAKGNSEPIGCIHLTAEGKVVDTKFDVKSDDDLETAAESAIATLKKTRNDHPDPVPDRLLSLTTKWLCFKFTVKQ